MLRVALLNGTKHNYDHDITAIIKALINANCVVEWLNVTSSQVGAWYGFIKAQRDNGDISYILVHLTANETIDTSGTKKVWIQLTQTHIDDSTLVNENQDNVATIETGASYPASWEYIKLASITSGTITDERVMLALVPWVNKEGAETINWVKTFSSFPILPSVTPSSNYQAVYKKYVDDMIALASSINSFEWLRVLWEDLSAGDTYFVGQWGDTIDNTVGTALDLNVWSSAWDQTRYVALMLDDVYTVLRRVTGFRINTQGTPAFDVTVYTVDADGIETQIASTSDSSLTLDAETSILADVDATMLKIYADGNNATNYYKVQVITDTVEQINTNEVSIDSEVWDSAVWTDFLEITITTLTEIQDIEFEFNSSYAYYYDDMDRRILKNGVVMHWPVDSGLPTNTSGWYTLTATWLTESVAQWDVIKLQMSNPANLSSWYPYSAKNFKLTGDGQTAKWNHDWWYDAGKKYLAKWTTPNRAHFDGIESTWWLEGVTTEGVEGGIVAISPSLVWPVFLDDDGWLTTTIKSIFIWDGKGTEMLILRQLDEEFEIVAWSQYILAEALTARTTSSVTPELKKEFEVDQAWWYLVEWNMILSSTTYIVYSQVYVNGIAVWVQKSLTDEMDDNTFFQDTVTVVAWDLVQIYAWTNNASAICEIREARLKYSLKPKRVKPATATVNTN